MPRIDGSELRRPNLGAIEKEMARCSLVVAAWVDGVRARALALGRVPGGGAAHEIAVFQGRYMQRNSATTVGHLELHTVCEMMVLCLLSVAERTPDH